MAYTSIDDGSAYFQVKTYSGTGATQSITNDGNSDLQPDWIWWKRRDAAYSHGLVDSSRGTGKYLRSDSSSAEGTDYAYITSFDSDGFTIPSGDQSSNNSSGTYVAWQWKANGGTTSSNTDGSITSTVQANTDAGFSIVTWTGNGTSGATVGHGLGVKPNHIIIRNRSTASINWTNYVEEIGATKFLQLNVTNAETTATNRFNDTEPTTSVFSLGDSSRSNGNTSDMIAYCFAEKQGYSKFGKYFGNGNAEGPFVYTGFKPAFVMWKQTNSARNWAIMDSARDPFNEVDQMVWADLTNAESTVTTDDVDFLSSGFKMRGAGATTNESGGTYIYMAFAENPFVTSTGIPTTAR